jgi:cytochrome c biogenesis protein CcmG/thiol:disulfide interchange protein DsbE
LLTVAIILAACGSDSQREVDREPISPLGVDEFRDMLEISDQPLVVNVWASWCGPCRSEAPLLRQAHERYGDRIRFVGIDVQDAQGPALDFLSEFEITYDNFFDPDGAIPASLGGFGVPLTYSFAAGGEQVFVQTGVIDDRALALQIDELLARS